MCGGREKTKREKRVIEKEREREREREKEEKKGTHDWKQLFNMSPFLSLAIECLRGTDHLWNIIHSMHN